MTCNEVLCNILIGLGTGIISGLIVSISLKKYWDKKQLKLDFESDKQKYERFLERIRTRLEIAEESGNYSEVQMSFDEEPIMETFSKLCSESQEQQQEIMNYVGTLKDKILRKIPLDISSEKRTIFKYRISILKYRMEK